MRFLIGNFFVIFLMFQSVNIAAQENQPLDSVYLNSQLENLLFMYSDSGNYEVVKYFLDKGVNSNITDWNGVTPLMFASQNGHYNVVDLLLRNNADPNKVPSDGSTALFAAVRAGNDSIAELLINYNADVNVQNVLGLTPLHYSVWYGMPYLTDLLVFHGAKVDTQDIYGNSPLMLSAYNGTYLSAKILLDNNANPNLVNNEGVSPLMIAAQFNDTSLLGLLYDYGADLNLVDSKGSNALVYAINSNSQVAIDFLIDLGAANQNLSKSYFQIAAETDFQNLEPHLDSLGLKTKIRPSVGSFFIGSGTIFSNHEFLWGFNAGFTEQLSKLNISIGYWFRPKPVATLEYRDMGIYQFKEKRQVFELKVNKRTAIKSFPRSSIWVYYGGNLGLILRNFKGTQNDPKTSVNPGFNAGICWGNQTTKFSLGWEFTNFDTPEVSKHRVGAHLSFFIPVSKPRMVKTNIDYVY